MPKLNKPRLGARIEPAAAEAMLLEQGIVAAEVTQAIFGVDGSLFVATSSQGHVFEHDPAFAATMAAMLKAAGVAVERG